MPWIELEPEADALRHHRRLADVGGAERGDDRRRPRRIGAVALGRLRPRVNPGDGRQLRQQRLRRHDGEPLGLEDAGDQPQRRVVAGPQAGEQARRQPQHGQVEPERPQPRPDDAAGEGDAVAAGGTQRGEEAAGALEAGGDHRMPGGPVERHAVEGDDAVGPAVAGAGLGDQPRQLAAAGDDGEAARHLSRER